MENKYTFNHSCLVFREKEDLLYDSVYIKKGLLVYDIYLTYFLLMDTCYIYIYIYRERERERERG